MNSNSKLLAIEQSGGLANKLKEIKDDRFRGIHGDAADLMIHLSENGLSRPQAIVSGIPFSTIEAEKCRRIIHAIEQALEPKGFFIAYQIRSTVVDYAAPYFGEPETSWVWWNFPPLRIFVWQKM
jgi:phospholipid N-methyltransferase